MSNRKEGNMVNGKRIKDLMEEKGIQGNEMAQTVGEVSKDFYAKG